MSDGQSIADLVHAVRFPIARNGYNAHDVDEFLDRLEGHHNPDGHGAAEPATDTSPSSSLTSTTPMIEPLPEEPGLFGKLFGRR
ncbi:DivIVA domain-containing protein [Luteococcus sp. H138]|uniref:DivIVA domain-containing protein n=1 Tax=unclassified Luteococcus TaxID=2639923 RepID=UPI00313B259D